MHSFTRDNEKTRNYKLSKNYQIPSNCKIQFGNSQINEELLNNNHHNKFTKCKIRFIRNWNGSFDV